MIVNRNRITPFVVFLSVLFFVVSTASAQGIRYLNRQQNLRLIEVPNLYVAGTSSSDAKSAQANSLQSIPQAIESTYLGKGLVVLKTSEPLLRTMGSAKFLTRSDGDLQFIYPVYRFPGSKLKVYPQPEVIVCIQDGADIEVIARRYNLTVLRGLLYTDDQFVLKMDSVRNPFEVSNELRTDPDVVWANVNYVRQIQKRFKPNDPLYPKQWHLNNTGQNGALPGADISAEAAWDLQMPSSDLVIAVVDDGVELNHPDLNLYTNLIEAAGIAGVDDDNNGLIDDIHGWDFADNDNDPTPDIAEDAHGTSVAGVAAAIGNNSVGVVGASFGSPILPCRISFGSEEEETTEEEDMAIEASIADAIRYAARYADVVNNSWGGTVLSDVVSSALDFATSNQGKRGDKIVPVLFATGNDATFFYPYKSDEFYSPGTYTIEVVYQKDASGSAGDDCVQIADIEFISIESEEIIESILPIDEYFQDGVEGSGDVPFSIVPSDKTESGFVYQSGAIGNNQESILSWTVTLQEEAYLTLSFRTSTEAEKDVFDIYIDGEPMDGGYVEGEDEETGEPIMKEAPFSGETPLNLVPIQGENTHPNVINIGASHDSDVRSTYSQWGPQIDFLAPSNGGINEIVTTDVSIPGFGYDPDSAYAEDFGGTSSACPLASGVFALVIAANPNLSVDELLDIFQKTSVKIGNLSYNASGFNEQYGYGKLNAFAAVQMALDRKGTPVSSWELY